MKNLVAVCDRQIEYAHRLMEYMNRKNSFFMKAAAFSEEDSIVEYGFQNKIDFLLISENILNEKTAAVKAKKKLVLSESRYPEHLSDIKNIYKYQPAGNIVREVMSSYEAENAVLRNDNRWRDRKKIIGIYTPAGGTRKTTFSLALGQILARQMPALYINMESFSGLQDILGLSCRSGLGDLLYYAKQPGADPAAKLPLMTVTVQNLDIVPPVQSPEDLRDISSLEWTEIFSGILSKSAYEVLLLEFGNEIRDIADIIEYCSVLYVPVREDPPAKAKIEEFEGYIKDKITDTGKIKKIRIPFNTVSALGKDFCENLIWSELGDYTRQLIQKERKIEEQGRYA
jgi:cellulose biosynthesis protein BcsQ